MGGGAKDENLNDIGDFMPLFANQAVDIAQVGIGISGITGAVQVANMGCGFALPAAMMSCPGSFICLGDSPGLGIEFDEGKMDALEVERVSQTAGPSRFERRRGAGLWDHPPSAEEIARARSQEPWTGAGTSQQEERYAVR